MTSASRGFGPAKSATVSRLLMMGAVCGLVMPCMAAMALSQQLHRWPIDESNFSVW